MLGKEGLFISIFQEALLLSVKDHEASIYSDISPERTSPSPPIGIASGTAVLTEQDWPPFLAFTQSAELICVKIQTTRR